MQEDYQQMQKKYAKTNKKIKINQKQDESDGWIVVKKKQMELSVSIADFNKVNRYYSHKSIQNYLRYILVQTVPNPMWLNIRRQSIIQQIFYLDIEIQNNLFQFSLDNKNLSFLSSISNQTNTALFKPSGHIARQNLWQLLFSYENEENIKEINHIKNLQQMPHILDQEIYSKYSTFKLTEQELKIHLYPNKQLPLYKQFYQPPITNKNIDIDIKNWILVVDCEMVLSNEGFQLARATIVNFEGQVIFDEYFKPSVQIINYCTEFSGITKQILQPVTNTLQNKLYPFIDCIFCDNTILVGHSLENDLRAMKLIHNNVIDSSVLYMRRNGTKLKLKVLSNNILKRQIQSGQHDSKEDCLATLDLMKLKIENHTNCCRRYDLLEQIQAGKKAVAVIDYAIDQTMKKFEANHYQITKKQDEISTIFKNIKKYMRKDSKIPELILTRIQKPMKLDWEQYYLQFDKAFCQFHKVIPKKTLIFVNCQINPNIQLASNNLPLKGLSASKNICIICAV